MNRQQIREQIARNLRLLSSDESTIIDNSNITEEGLNTQIDLIYREGIVQVLMDKFPDDFERKTEPKQTFTSSFVVQSIASDVITALPGTFSNFDEGFEAQNVDKSETIKIIDVLSDTEAQLESTPESDWTGDTVYVLGNEFFFEGEAEDLREIKLLGIKYNANDNEFLYGNLRRKHDVLPLDQKNFNRYNPVMYLTAISKENISTGATKNLRGVGILPFPNAYNGEYQITYMQQPPSLTDTTSPVPLVAGISEGIIRGVTAWGARILQDYNMSVYYDNLYKEQKAQIINSYKPRSRGNPSRLRLAPHYQRISKNVTY